MTALDEDDLTAVTGASGWLGMTFLAELERRHGDAFEHRVRGFASIEKTVRLSSGREVLLRPLEALVESAPTRLLHCAYRTREVITAIGPRAYIAGNLALTAEVLTVLHSGSVRSFAYASSGAVYGCHGEPVVDLRREPYGALKRIDELAFGQACEAIGIPCVIPRIFALVGPYITKPQAYAVGSLLQMALRGEDLHVHSADPVFRAYSAARDVVRLVLALLDDERSVVFDTGGTVLEIGELAAIVQELLAPSARIARPDVNVDGGSHYYSRSNDMSDLMRELGLASTPLRDELIATSAWLEQRTHVEGEVA